MSKHEQTQAIVDELRIAVPQISGALIATVTGLAIARSISVDTDHERVAAMAATALALGKRITETLEAGAFTETLVSGTKANVYIYAAGAKGVLAVITSPDANLGLLHLEARDAAAQIAEILEQARAGACRRRASCTRTPSMPSTGLVRQRTTVMVRMRGFDRLPARSVAVAVRR